MIASARAGRHGQRITDGTALPAVTMFLVNTANAAISLM